MQQQKISLNGPPDLLAVLPYHLGFHPSRSVVVVCLHDKRLGLVARYDVIPDLSRASAVADSLLHVLEREAVTGVMVIGYEDEPGESEPLSQAIAAGVALAHITLIDRVVVRGDRWTGLMCTCCPDEPVPAPYEVGAVATYVALGRAALGSRDDLASRVLPSEPTSDDLVEAIDEWVAAVVDRGQLLAPLPGSGLGPRRAVTWADHCLAAWADLFAGHYDKREVPDRTLRLLLGSLRDRGLRDGIIALTCPGSLGRDALAPRLAELLEDYLGPVLEDLPDLEDLEDGDDLDDAFAGLGDPGEEQRGRVRSRLERLCRLAPDAHAAPVLTVTGAHAWFGGDGAAARVAIERALDVEPGHVLARLIAHLIDMGIRAPGTAAA